MKKIKWILFFIILTLHLYARENICLNFGWKYQQGKIVGAEVSTFNDRSWQWVNLPHDASIYGPFQKDHGGTVRNGFRPLNCGWYRKHIEYNNKWKNKHIILMFEGVYRMATVYVNGLSCGPARQNGYLDFEYDITGMLHDGDNVVAVSYDNTFARSSRWYNGEGINRNVWLQIVDALHIDRYGTYVTTPEISTGKAKVVVDTNVKNDNKDSVLCQLITEIVDPKGHVVASRKAVAPFAAGEIYHFHQEIDIENPQLWQVGQGVMYRVVSRLENDEYETPFGIRSIQFSPDQGLLINGKRVYVNGVCLHTDLGPLGTASFDAAWDRRLSVIVDSLGCNAIRLSHNVYPNYVLDWADRHGVLVFDEMFDKWNESFYGSGTDFPNMLLTDMRTWMRRDRNHPSVFVWSVGNEVYEQIQKDKTQKNGVERLKQLVTLGHEMDPSRKITVGQYPNRYGCKTLKNYKYFYELEPHQFEFYADVVSTNYLERFWDRDHKKYPQLVFIESEMAVGDLGYDFFNFDHSYPVGQFYWGGTDYIGESMGWPAKGWVRGLIDFTNRLKPLGQSIRSFYTTRRMVKIVTRPRGGAGSRVWNDLKMTWIPLEEHWNYQQGDTVTVQVMSNCYETELLLNGHSLGRKLLPPSNCPPELTWPVVYIPGELRAVGYNKNGEKIVDDIVKTSGKPARIVTDVDTKSLKANGLDLAYVNFTVVDKNGNIVVQTPVILNFYVTGTASIAGVASGDMLSNEPWQGSCKTTYNGRCQLIIRAAHKSGMVKILVKAKGLKTIKLEIPIK